MAQKDNSAISLTQLDKIKYKNESLHALKESTEKSKVEAEVKIEQLILDKADLKMLHSEVEGELNKVEGTIYDLQVKADTTVSERELLTGEHQTTINDKVAVELEALEWDITYKAQKENIDHFVFILDPHTDKLLADLATEIIALPMECGVEVNLASPHAPKATPPSTNIIIADDNGNGEVVDDLSVVT